MSQSQHDDLCNCRDCRASRLQGARQQTSRLSNVIRSPPPPNGASSVHSNGHVQRQPAPSRPESENGTRTVGVAFGSEWGGSGPVQPPSHRLRILMIHGAEAEVSRQQTTYTFGGVLARHWTFEGLQAGLHEMADRYNINVKFFHSLDEREIVNRIRAEFDITPLNGIVICPGILTFTGGELQAALIEANVPFIEVHVNDLYHQPGINSSLSLLLNHSEAVIGGFGPFGYHIALSHFVGKWNLHPVQS